MDLRSALEPFIAPDRVRGLAAVFASGERIDVVALGDATRETIFRISSMTKPVTAALAMLLVDDGVLSLDEPIAKRLPELADRRVLRTLESELDDTVAAHHQPTVRELLTFTWGFGMALTAKPLPIQRAMAQLELGQGPPRPSSYAAPDAWVRQLATLPLMVQPGSRWLYSAGSDVLTVLLARAGGKPFDVLLEERIFAPLGMRDTAFWVPPDKRARFTPVWSASGPFDAVDGEWSRAPRFPSGAAGLVSTIDDFLAFSRALLDGRLLSRAAFAQLTSDQLTPAQRAASPWPGDFFAHHSWGYGGAVSDGAYGWDGGFGSAWRIAPATGDIAVLMTNRMWDSPAAPPIVKSFWGATGFVG